MSNPNQAPTTIHEARAAVAAAECELRSAQDNYVYAQMGERNWGEVSRAQGRATAAQYALENAKKALAVIEAQSAA
jgi:hypothetical protein